MIANSHDDDVFKAKRKPKNPISFKLNLNEEQKEAKRIILKSSITILLGSAGSGKTLTATQIALDLFFNREVDKIVITRPTVTEEDLGFLPGDISQKMDPWLQPIYQNFYALYGKEKIDKEISEGNIEILPMSYIRGITFVNTFVIADEVQNLTHTQMEALLGRLGQNSKMVLCGDLAQVDLPKKKQSGLKFITEITVEGLSKVTLKQNHRHSIVELILKKYDEYRNR
jgi:phosphate starvation-inducible PhoH-like protein